MACVFPGAPDLTTYWKNIRDGVDAITDVPADRWDPVFYDPESSAADRFYCRRGGFIGEFALFDALGFGIMPIAAQGAEPDQLMALEVAARALRDAGYDLDGGAGRKLPGETTGVVIGRGNYIGAGMTRLEQHVRTAQQLVECLKTLVPGISTDQLAAVKAEFQSRLGGYGPDTAIGLVPNLTSSRIANRLDMYGPAFTVDAACASSLVAVDSACRELESGRADLMLAGGVHLSHDVAFWSVFCQLGALSRGQQIKPFDANADGILIGEGVGLVVLKRLSDAERDGDRIYAVISGSGIASDGRDASLMTPRVDGQLLALKRAWGRSGLDPESVGLIEAHGTGTPVGDGAELETLARFFGTTDGDRAALGSVKSMIGHAMPAAGAAGLIKAALALYHGVIPPTLHVETPHPGLEATRFQLPQKATPWPAGGKPRVAGVNAFGFGGINGHVVLRGHADSRKARNRGNEPEELLLLAAGSPQALARALEAGVSAVGTGACRLALVNPTPERRARARDVVLAGKPRSGRDGLWFSPEGLITRGGGVAFIFPGVEASFDPRVEDVATHFGLPQPDIQDGTDLERQGAGVVAVGRLLHEVMRTSGVTPDALAGHSVGEWTGMILSGIIPEADRFIAGLRPGSLEVPGVVFAACGGSAERVRVLIEDLTDVVVTHDNCPHQIILCGPEEHVDIALQ
ncbi:MAG: acyl transferase domain-containing protein [Myxococcota bacterium]|jgi:acyl transferase domain-containing protein